MASHLTTEQSQQIEGALAAGQKIVAIKLYREFTGAGLKESKDVIDALAAELLRQDPAKYAALARAGKGCAAVLVAVLGVAGALLAMAVACGWRTSP